MIVAMSDQTGTETVDIAEEIKAADPYGDVALGVECAWPRELLVTPSAEESAE
jgi:hypothetical protein